MQLYTKSALYLKVRGVGLAKKNHLEGAPQPPRCRRGLTKGGSKGAYVALAPPKLGSESMI